MVRGYCSSAVIGDNLYCAERDGQILERFDIRKNSWQIVADRPLLSSHKQLVAVADELYSISENGVFKFNPRSKYWSCICDVHFTEFPVAIAMDY